MILGPWRALIVSVSCPFKFVTSILNSLMGEPIS
jgi:hypothetical protein